MNTLEIQEIESALKKYLPKENDLRKKLFESMEYSLMAGGKRIRPSWYWNSVGFAAGTLHRPCPLPVRWKWFIPIR